VLTPLYRFIGYMLAVAYTIVPAHNLGLAIILLTCVVMLALFPLTAKQARSMIAMQKVQPEIKRLQAKYKGDKQKQNEEVLKFYQENKINPLAGCLPLLMQFPIFISLFHVLKSVQSNVPTTGRFNLLFVDICGPNATSASNCQNPPTGLRFLGMDLSKSLYQVRGSSIITLIPYVISILLIIATGWYQARQTMARQQKSATATPINAQMQFMTKVFPIMFGVFSLRFASGLVVYWITSNTWRIGQQHLVLNKIYDSANAKPTVRASDDDDDIEAESKPSEGGKGSDSSGSTGAKSPGGPKPKKPTGSNGKPQVRRPGSPVPPRDTKRGNGTGNGAAAPATSGNRRKKRKR
jgi:YidC/Oxa1 family membrane protein insertase